jgi:hypothetical protein
MGRDGVAVDWLASTIEQRKTLYRTLRQIIDREGENWNSIFRAAIGSEAEIGIGYQDNFRAGRIARTKAHRLYRWLTDAYPTYAAALVAELEGDECAFSSGAAWDKFLTEHGRFVGIEAVLMDDPSISLVTFAKREPLAQPIIPLGASFYFRVNSEQVGRVVALQSVEDRWHGLPLRPDGLADAVTAGANILPRLADSDQPLPLSEEQDGGRHGFLFLIGDGELIDSVTAMILDGALAPALLDDIARCVLTSDTAWSLRRINLLVQA